MDKRDLQRLIMNYSLRGRVFSYPELYVLTGQKPQYFENKGCFGYDLEPSLSLIDNHKNNLQSDVILNNYSRPENFQVVKNRHGYTTKYNTFTGSAFMQSQQQSSQQWFWKQLQLQKFGFWFYCVPGLSKVFICSSVVNKTANNHSDVDLIVLTKENSVWFTKAYFAVIAKVLKYYNFNFLLGLYNYLWDQNALELQKQKCLEGKMKIDFGLVTNDLDLVDFYYCPIWYRSLFVYELIEIESEPVGYTRYQELLPMVYFARLMLKGLLFLFYPIIMIFGLLNYRKNLELQTIPSNKIVKWDIYSQYNVIN